MRTAIPLLVTVAIVPAMLSAQAPSYSMNHRLAKALAQIRPGQRVRLNVRETGRLEGVFLRTGPDTVLVVVGPIRQGVPITQVDALWLRGRATKTGALVGSVSGAIALGVAGLAVVTSENTGECTAGCGALPFAAAGVGGIVGALIGAGIGAVIPRWHRRFP